VWLDCRGEAGLRNFEALKAHQAAIEAAVGESLVWTVDDGREQGSLSIRLSGLDANDRSDWPRQHKVIGDRLLRLYNAVKPYVEPLLQVEAEDPE
jgi:hypothetical protein